MAFSSKEFCPTPYPNCTTYNNIYKKKEAEAEEERKNNSRGVYVVQNPKGVGQNKNTQLQDEKVAVITKAIRQLITDKQKITVRKIQKLSGVAKATVEKHYKVILADLSQDNTQDKQISSSDNKAPETICNNEKLLQKKIALEERFNSVVSGKMIVPDLIIVLGSKTTNKIPIANWSELIRNVNKDGFDNFWNNLQNYKNSLRG
jgi:predicted RNA-binding protein YlxR (DUF448 family)